MLWREDWTWSSCEYSGARYWLLISLESVDDVVTSFQSVTRLDSNLICIVRLAAAGWRSLLSHRQSAGSWSWGQHWTLLFSWERCGRVLVSRWFLASSVQAILSPNSCCSQSCITNWYNIHNKVRRHRQIQVIKLLDWLLVFTTDACSAIPIRGNRRLTIMCMKEFVVTYNITARWRLKSLTLEYLFTWLLQVCAWSCGNVSWRHSRGRHIQA